MVQSQLDHSPPLYIHNDNLRRVTLVAGIIIGVICVIVLLVYILFNWAIKTKLIDREQTIGRNRATVVELPEATDDEWTACDETGVEMEMVLSSSSRTLVVYQLPPPYSQLPSRQE